MRYRYPDAIYYDGTSGIIDDVINAGKDIIATHGGSAASDAAEEALKKLTPAQKAATEKILAQVEARARAGVVSEVKSASIPLALLALSLGAVGGFVLRGKIGLAVAVGLAGYAAYTIGSKK